MEWKQILKWHKCAMCLYKINDESEMAALVQGSEIQMGFSYEFDCATSDILLLSSQTSKVAQSR